MARTYTGDTSSGFGSYLSEESFAPEHAQIWDKLRRAAARQAPLFAVFIVASLAIGAAFVMFTRAEPDVLAIWAALGAVSGYAVAASREWRRNAIGLIASVKRESGCKVLGATPAISARELRDLPPDRRSPLGCVMYKPASAAAAAFRALQRMAEQRQLVAFIGSVPNEGATTAALCTAACAAQQSRKVLLIDCDLRRRSLSKALECETEFGVLEAARDPQNWRKAIHEEPETGFHFIAAAALRDPWRSLFAEPGLATLLQNLREDYDLILLDCPPVSTVSDGAIIARNADACFIVAAWDSTPASALRSTMRTLRQFTARPAGVCINRMPPRRRADEETSLLF